MTSSSPRYLRSCSQLLGEETLVEISSSMDILSCSAFRRLEFEDSALTEATTTLQDLSKQKIPLLGEEEPQAWDLELWNELLTPAEVGLLQKEDYLEEPQDEEDSSTRRPKEELKLEAVEQIK
ncbi:hypothetical protein DH2020_021586 [Rehmannia glutinosa]|uniref:Uncharacterized protein n=1 Tax=Rehmannia glutinosa TaxID=99300 RepID=A0ABR0WDV9_REHGL